MIAAKSELMRAESDSTLAEVLDGVDGVEPLLTEVFPENSAVLNLAAIMLLLAEVPTHFQEISAPAFPFKSTVNSCSLFLALSLVLALDQLTAGLAGAVPFPETEAEAEAEELA